MNQIAVVFPGQGSQSVGMLDQWMTQSDETQEMLSQASDVLGYDLEAIIANNPEDALNQTAYTQPAIYTVSAIIWHAMSRCFDIEFAAMAGHSLGEYSALMAAGVFSFEEGLRLVAKRGELMQAASPEGKAGMLVVIGLQDEAVDSLCTEIEIDGHVIGPANYNSPGQVVVAGELPALDRFEQLAKSHGAKLVKRLAMSVPSHSPLMMKAAESFGGILDEIKFQAPRVPVYSNVTGTYHDAPDEIKTKLQEQLVSPVRWASSVEHMVKAGVTHQLEVGPGKVLTGLGKRIDRSLDCSVIQVPDDIAPICDSLK